MILNIAAILYHCAIVVTSTSPWDWRWTPSFNVYAMIQAEPWIALMTVIYGLFLGWISILLFSQLYQIVILAMTTNERMNVERYQHFHTEDGKIKSPFNKGPLLNALNFLRNTPHFKYQYPLSV